MSQESNISLATRGMSLFRGALWDAMLRLQAVPMSAVFTGPADWGIEIRDRLSRFVLKTLCYRALKQSVWSRGASRKEIRRLADETVEALLLFEELASKLIHDKLPEEFRNPKQRNTEYPSPLVFLEKTKTCTPDEYEDWARQAIGEMLESIGVPKDKRDRNSFLKK